MRTLDFQTPVPRRFPAASIAKPATVNGPLAGGVPGSLAGWATLLQTYGTKPLSEALAPAITLARDGVPISPFYLDMLAACASRPMSDQWRRVYGCGGAPRGGQVLKQPELADTLAGIAAHGAGTLYGGALGRRDPEALGPPAACPDMHAPQTPP